MSGSISDCSELNVRVAGIEGTAGVAAPQTGIVPGVKYFRKYQKNGVIRPAHVELTAIRNHIRTDLNGQRVTSTDNIKIEAWNRDNDDGAGRGIADMLAKWYSTGKAFSFVKATLRSYKRRVYLSTGAIVTEANGAPVMVPAHSFVLNSIGNILPGDESAKTIAREISNWLAGSTTNTFFSRPPNWNIPGNVDNVRWKEILQWRSAQKFDGTQFYGNAKVFMIEGATPADGFPAELLTSMGTVAPTAMIQPAAGTVPTVETNAAILQALIKIMPQEQLAAVMAGQVAQPAAPLNTVAPTALVVGEDVPF